MKFKYSLQAALKQLGFDKPRKAQIIPMNTLDAEQDAIIIAATGSGKQVIYETVGLAHSDKLTIVIEPLLALIYNQVQISAKRQELEAVQTQLAAQEADNEELSRQLEASDEEIIEQVARDELGYAKPGERVFVDMSGK